jgi:hypothetical protein
MIIALIKLAYLSAARQFSRLWLRAAPLDQTVVFGNTRMAARTSASREKTKEAGPAFNRRYAWSWIN